MVGLTDATLGTATGRGAADSEFKMTAMFDAFQGGRAPSNMFEQWISMFPTAPMFGVRWAFADLMKPPASFNFPATDFSAWAAPLCAPMGPMTKTVAKRPLAPSVRDAETAVLDSVGAAKAQHLRLVQSAPAAKAEAAPKPADASVVKEAAPKPAARKKADAPKAKAEAPAKPASTKKAAPKAPKAPIAVLSKAPAKPDDLKLIRGLGGKLEAVLNDLGIFTFAQLTDLSPEAYDWLDERLGVARGRPRRDDWAGQAKELLEAKK